MCLPKGIVNFLVDDADASAKDTKIIEVSTEKLYKIAQISLPWEGPEELWNIIGFANIRNRMFVNLMSDLDLVKRPGLFHQRERHQYRAFTDFSTTPEGPIREFLEARRLFLEALEDCVKSENVNKICPSPEAWSVLLRLHDRLDAEKEGYFTMVDKTAEELVRAESGKIELIHPLAPLLKP